MNYAIIHNIHVPVLGFGTWQLRGLSCEEAVIEALAIGYRHIDTAAMYDNEEYVGKGLKKSGIERNDIFLTTKVWHTHLKHHQVLHSVHQSLQKLETDYVDLLLIHWPNVQVPLRETFDAMLELQQAGKVKHIGVSNFTPSLLKEALTFGKIFCNQVEYHPYLSQQKLLTFCQEYDILLTAYAPIAHGKVNEDKTLIEIGKRYGKTPVQVTLRWLIQQPKVSAIPKASSTKHRQSNFEIFDFELTNDEMQTIFELSCNLRLVNPSWDHNWNS